MHLSYLKYSIATCGQWQLYWTTLIQNICINAEILLDSTVLESLMTVEYKDFKIITNTIRNVKCSFLNILTYRPLKFSSPKSLNR